MIGEHAWTLSAAAGFGAAIFAALEYSSRRNASIDWKKMGLKSVIGATAGFGGMLAYHKASSSSNASGRYNWATIGGVTAGLIGIVMAKYNDASHSTAIQVGILGVAMGSGLGFILTEYKKTQ
jgi:hypothetical protein